MAYNKAIEELSLSIREGQSLGVVGESGSGKTTLGRALVQLIPSEGDVTFNGNVIDSKDKKSMLVLKHCANCPITKMDKFFPFPVKFSNYQFCKP